jgi:hypothetical protein
MDARASLAKRVALASVEPHPRGLISAMRSHDDLRAMNSASEAIAVLMVTLVVTWVDAQTMKELSQSSKSHSPVIAVRI